MKYQITSLGCPKNRVDSELVASSFSQEGWESVANPQEADLVILNTCSFIEPAIEESVQEIKELLKIKKTHHFKFVVAGCLVDRDSLDLTEEFKGVDLIISSSQLINMPKIIKDGVSGFITGKKGLLYSADKHLVSSTYPHVYLKISEGCNNCCTYCTIPFIKGPYRSRKFEDIVNEAEYFLKLGYKELILVSQDSGLYGYDLYGELKLHELLKKITALDFEFWLRVLYVYPTRITPNLITVFSQEKKLLKYLDIPLQHTHSEILKGMGRNYDYQFILKLFSELRSSIPDIILRSTFIVGFPGEKEDNFKFLLQSLKELSLPRVGFFPYYSENGTKAANYLAKVRPSTIERRLLKAQETQEKIRMEFNKKQVGKVLEVLIEQDREQISGRSYMDAPEIDAQVIISEYSKKPKVGDIVKVLVTGFEEVDLIGKIV